MKTFATKRVRAWNVKPGDVIEVVRKVRGKWVTGPKHVESVVESFVWPGDVEIHFKHWHMAYHAKRQAIVRVRRLEVSR